jgi:hypothetical protein
MISSEAAEGGQATPSGTWTTLIEGGGGRRSCKRDVVNVDVPSDVVQLFAIGLAVTSVAESVAAPSSSSSTTIIGRRLDASSSSSASRRSRSALRLRTHAIPLPSSSSSPPRLDLGVTPAGAVDGLADLLLCMDSPPPAPVAPPFPWPFPFPWLDGGLDDLASRAHLAPKSHSTNVGSVTVLRTFGSPLRSNSVCPGDAESEIVRRWYRNGEEEEVEDSFRLSGEVPGAGVGGATGVLGR